MNFSWLMAMRLSSLKKVTGNKKAAADAAAFLKLYGYSPEYFSIRVS